MDISKQHVCEHLTGNGFFLDIGLFSFNIKSSITSIADSLVTLYTDYPNSFPFQPETFVDFDVRVDAPDFLHRYFKRQAQFSMDGFAPFTPLPMQHAPAMIEWGMNWCISNHVNSHLIIHSAVIEKNGFAVMMPAPPGSGKSTLTASLIQHGWRLLSDELTLIRLDNYQVVPVPRPVSLKNESIDLIQQRYPEVVFGPLSTDTSKGTVGHMKPPAQSIQNKTIECPIGWVIFPKYQAAAEANLQPKGKAETLMAIADNAFNYSHLGVSGFNTLKTVVDQAECYQFQYSQLDDALHIFEQLAKSR